MSRDYPPRPLTVMAGPPSVLAATRHARLEPGDTLELTGDGTIAAPRIAREPVRRARRLRRALRSAVVVTGTTFALLIVVMALFAGILAPVLPDEQNFDLIETPPGGKALLGTDRFGRDVLSRVIYGARISLYVALLSIGVAMLSG